MTIVYSTHSAEVLYIAFLYFELELKNSLDSWERLKLKSPIPMVMPYGFKFIEEDSSYS